MQHAMNILVFILVATAVVGGLTMGAASAVSVLSRETRDKLAERLGKVGLIVFLVGAILLIVVGLAALGYTVFA